MLTPSLFWVQSGAGQVVGGLKVEYLVRKRMTAGQVKTDGHYMEPCSKLKGTKTQHSGQMSQNFQNGKNFRNTASQDN